jgi:FG-GAP-like repeat
VSVLLGRGDGTFQAPLTLPVGSGPFSLTAGDFNHDGHLDLVAANSGSHDVSILLGRGDGTFQNQVRYAIGPNAVSPLSAISTATAASTWPLRIRTQTTFPSCWGAATPAGDEVNIYVVGEDQESAVLLTSFGIAVPAASSPPQAPPLTDVFVVNGPGFAAGIDVLSLPAEVGVGLDPGAAAEGGDQARRSAPGPVGSLAREPSGGPHVPVPR